MRRSLTTLVAVALLAGATAAPADAAKKKPKKPVVRTIELRYDQPALGVGGVAGGCNACPALPVGTTERYAVITIEDANSPNGYVDFMYDPDGDGIQNPGSGPTVCGSTAEPVPVEAGQTYTVWPWAAGVGCAGASSTSETITILLSNDPAALKAALGG